METFKTIEAIVTHKSIFLQISPAAISRNSGEIGHLRRNRLSNPTRPNDFSYERDELSRPVLPRRTPSFSSRERPYARLLVVGSAVCGGSGAAFIASSEDPSKTLKLCTNIPVRLFRNTVTAASMLSAERRSCLSKEAKDGLEYLKCKRLQTTRSDSINETVDFSTIAISGGDARRPFLASRRIRLRVTSSGTVPTAKEAFLKKKVNKFETDDLKWTERVQSVLFTDQQRMSLKYL
ncbi:unnamed protein product [Eruca vesicaria subsp. sativa]|uniref:Uncharacterized protein n=1 Tax=Eruca vesicaria subsp. sativa TaxID=29727 RepID=A0ABC8KUF5_ERUVS|nr:unnamed protein product [Eruca vesicaria subsp. sativa]